MVVLEEDSSFRKRPNRMGMCEVFRFGRSPKADEKKSFRAQSGTGDSWMYMQSNASICTTDGIILSRIIPAVDFQTKTANSLL